MAVGQEGVVGDRRERRRRGRALCLGRRGRTPRSAECAPCPRPSRPSHPSPLPSAPLARRNYGPSGRFHLTWRGWLRTSAPSSRVRRGCRSVQHRGGMPVTAPPDPIPYRHGNAAAGRAGRDRAAERTMLPGNAALVSAGLLSVIVWPAVAVANRARRTAREQAAPTSSGHRVSRPRTMRLGRPPPVPRPPEHAAPRTRRRPTSRGVARSRGDRNQSTARAGVRCCTSERDPFGGGNRHEEPRGDPRVRDRVPMGVARGQRRGWRW